LAKDLEMKKILFLDIDGVLNSDEWHKTGYKSSIDDLDPNLVRKLNSLDCEVVITSSWGCDNGQTWKALRRKGFNLKVIGYTERTNNDWTVRGNMIKKWLYDNCHNIDYQYAILDDDSDMLLEQKDHFVQTNSEIGVTDEDINKIKIILDSNIL
jgi:hypothetical protein